MRSIGTIFKGEWHTDWKSTDTLSRRLIYRVKGYVEVLLTPNPDGPWEVREELEIIGEETKGIERVFYKDLIDKGIYD